MPKTTNRRYRRANGRKLNKRQIKQVKRVVGNEIETKYTISLASGNFTNTPLFGLCTNIASGILDLNNRIGDQVTLKRLEIRFVFSSIYSPTITTDQANLMRMIVFRYKDTSDGTTVININQLLNDPTRLYSSPTNIDNMRSGKIKIVYDKLFQINYQNNFYYTFRKVFYGKKLGKKRIGFAGATASANDHLWYMIVSDSAAIPHPQIAFDAYTHYTDA